MEKITMIKLKDLKPSKHNYRSSMSQSELNELAASIKEKGIINPLIARAINGKIEIVAGHRRYEAAKSIGLEEVPVIIRELSEDEALELQIIENSQRENPNPVDEAQGFQYLLKKGLDAETIAFKIGKAVPYVYGRMKLLELPEQARKALIKGNLSFGQAKLLLRLNPKEQKEFLKGIIESKESLAQSKERLKRYATNLKEAVFDVKSCGKCPYLSSNQQNLFEDKVEDNECTNIPCFIGKTFKHYQEFIKEKKKEGYKILEPEEIPDSWSSKMRRISPKKTRDWNVEHPPQYKEMCIPCKEHHGFYLKKDYRGYPVFGEMCLNPRCLDKQLGRYVAPEKSEKKSEERDDTHHARACRDRFLRDRLPEKVVASKILQKRLIIYHLLERYGYFYGDAATERADLLGLKDDSSHYLSERVLYGHIMKIPEKNLDTIIVEILSNILNYTPPEVLLQMTTEAGINVLQEFKMDETYLNSKTKAELVGLVKNLKLDVEVNEKMKKPEILEAILKLDLTGKVTPSIKTLCSINKLKI